MSPRCSGLSLLSLGLQARTGAQLSLDPQTQAPADAGSSPQAAHVGTQGTCRLAGALLLVSLSSARLTNELRLENLRFLQEVLPPRSPLGPGGFHLTAP